MKVINSENGVVVYFGVLFLTSKGVLFPFALDFARELRNDRFNVGSLVEDSEASVSPIILSTCTL
jgi:hypothetical protein